MQGSVRKKGATWSYRVEFGVIDGKRNQIERSGFKTNVTFKIFTDKAEIPKLVVN